MQIQQAGQAAENQQCFSTKMSEKHIRVAVVGNVDAGKSSLIGTLKTGHLDDGRGQARSQIMIHKHEIDTGRTSTIATHLLGFDVNMKPIVSIATMGVAGSSNANIKNDADVAAKAHTLVTLMDLAGHEKYLKTTVHGISSGMIDYALVLVNSRQRPTHMTRHHIGLAVACNIPIIIVLTKTDGCPAHVLKSTKEEIKKILSSSPEIQKKSYQIKSEFDVNIVKDKLHAITPVIQISCVTGEGLDLLSTLICSLPKRRRHQQKIGRPFEHLVEDVYHLTGVGTVVSGFVNAGRISVGQKVFIGPVHKQHSKDGNVGGSFIETQIKSAHIARTHVKSVVAGNNACFALALSKADRKLIRSGMVLLGHEAEASACFEADMVILKGSGVDGTTIRKNYETMIHILHMKQCARVEKIELLQKSNHFGSIGGNGSVVHDSEGGGNENVVVRPGSRAKMTFRFKMRREYIRPGMRILFRDGHVRGCGVITNVGIV